jgi:A/G-specific adenine glycosylase
VRKLWEGLGYYSRARNLHATAKFVAGELGGEFPRTWEELQKLKGIGPYTARAIASFAFGQEAAVLDGNVFRVVSRFLADASPIDLPATRKIFKGRDAASFNHAIMDLGATVCIPRQPLCGVCPLAKGCVAFREEKVHDYPVKAKKLVRKQRYFHFFLLRDLKRKISVRQRPDKGLWAGLFEIPNQEVKKPAWKKSRKGLTFRTELVHVFTHFDMHIRVYEGPPGASPEQGDRFISTAEIPIFAFSRAVLRIFESCPDEME